MQKCQMADPKTTTASLWNIHSSDKMAFYKGKNKIFQIFTLWDRLTSMLK